jgi:hypothetical protein
LCLLERAGPPEVDAERIDAILAVDESKNDAVCPPYYSEQLSAAIRVRLRMSWMSDPAEEQISHSEEDHGFGDVEALLVIADQPALCIAPVWPSQPRQPVFSTRLLLCSRKRRDTWIPVALTAGHQRPHYARRLVCERDGSELRRRACQQLHEPRPAGALRSACRITAMAPTTSIWRRYRLPALVRPPRRTLLPEEFAVVTSR